ncbi:hypothetical protein BB560_006698 [Smittium megazygosporum]|uniref:CRESS-DNA virus Rep endonuclease domain-containing protein n=1 Tax=Smittium megazygosporum TaxID=133381 RepID=A0A2T9Y2G1_9FUNG|nr:hypothetical protein BB560_006698 [Smittium megazygosporum]
MLNLQAGKQKVLFLLDYRPDPELDAFVASPDIPTQSPNIAYSPNPSIVFGNAIATTSTSKITTTKTTTMHQYLTVDSFKPKSTSPLRFSALQFFLTYPKMDNTKDEVVKALIAKNIPILKYVVAKELHADKSSHIHVYIKFKDKINTTNPEFFDILGQHGHYETLKNRSKLLKYITVITQNSYSFCNVLLHVLFFYWLAFPLCNVPLHVLFCYWLADIS